MFLHIPEISGVTIVIGAHATAMGPEVDGGNLNIINLCVYEENTYLSLQC